ncbi:efflux RND transporter periplasmic adaptor subunit [Roseospira navarrensis]|uniref:Efflux RND transporter periplasmic adaptor subunit n=1 Tax=Roseospira navarrensis TaxID=140058 RepID=A0A7X1ZGX3_9PROT|nr:efflux RND transporter periplasmic adaptor subunit [Roseospira navarrensis]MQX38103.1 efflux RND transporter periplasmic adaptor subunit [Roseospira navarrensis]
MSMSRRGPAALAVILLFAVSVSVFVLGAGADTAAAQAPQGERPPQAVTVVPMVTQAVTLLSELPGRVVASGVAEVRPQVDGIIIERLYDEGSDVTVGQPLYRIDDATYRARLASAEAQVAQARAALRAADRDANRQDQLVREKVASVRTLDEAVAARDTAAAAVQVAEADLQTAQIDLDRTIITAPLNGVIGRSLTTQGALVTSGQAQPLATIRTIDPVLVDVTQSAAEILAWRRGQHAAPPSGQADAVSLILADGVRYEHDGSLKAAEPYVNEQTGVVTLRLQFQNPDRLLLPGMYVRVLMPQGVLENVVLTPQRAVTYDRRGRPIALVVNADNVVEERTLDIVEARGSDWIVRDGLSDGDRVIVAGLQKVRPGATVTPQAADAPASGSDSDSAANANANADADATSAPRP